MDEKSSQDEQIGKSVFDLEKEIEILKNVNQNLRDENKRLLDSKTEEIQKVIDEWTNEYNATMDFIYEGIFALLNLHHARKLNRLLNDAPVNNSV